MDKEIKHKYGQNISDRNGKPGNPIVSQNPSNDGQLSDREDKKPEIDKGEKNDETEIQENKSSKEQKNRVRK